MNNIEEEYDSFVRHLRETAREAESLMTTKRRLSRALELWSSTGVGRLPADVRAWDASKKMIKEPQGRKSASVR